MHLTPHPTLRRRIVRRSILPAIFLACWIATLFADLEVGREWTSEFPASVLPFTANGSGRFSGRWSIATVDGALTYYRSSEESGFFYCTPPKPLTVHWFLNRRLCDLYDYHITSCIVGRTDRNRHCWMSSSRILENYTSPSIPYYLLTALASIPLLHLLWTNRRSARRQSATLCPTRAYDLRAHLPGQHCPECGTPIASKNQLKACL